MVLFPKHAFRPTHEVFLAKNQTLNVGKIRNYDEECFFEKKRFDLVKSLRYQNRKAQNMPVVAGLPILILVMLISFVLLTLSHDILRPGPKYLRISCDI